MSLFALVCCARTTESFSSGAAAQTASAAGASVADGSDSDLVFQNDAQHLTAHWRGFSGAITGYEHNASASSACEGSVAKAQAVASPQTTDTLTVTLQAGQKYFNCVRGVAANGPSDWVASDGVTIDNVAPSAPAQLNAFSQLNQVSLSWAETTDDDSGVDSYEVAYCEPAPCTLPEPPQLTDIVSNSIVALGLAGCQNYAFGVRARDKAGNASAYSPLAEASAQVPPPANFHVVGNVGRVEIAFDPVAGATDYQVCYGDEPGACDVNAVSTAGKTGVFLDNLPLTNLYIAARTSENGCFSDETSEVLVALAPQVELTTIYTRSTCAASTQSPNEVGQAVAAYPDASQNANTLVTLPNFRDPGSCTTESPSPGFIMKNGSQFAYGYDQPDLHRGNTGLALAAVGKKEDDEYAVLAYAHDAHFYSAGDFDGGIDFKAINSPLVNTTPDATYALTGAAHSRFGSSLGDIGDSDNDGISDFVVLSDGTAHGTFAIYSGTQSSVPILGPVAGPTTSSFDPAQVVGAGDLDGDGKPDFLLGLENTSVGAHAFVGAVYAYSTAQAALVPFIAGTIPTGASNSRGNDLGCAVTQAGDLNGDGVPDFAVGSGDEGGQIAVYSGTMSHPQLAVTTGVGASAVAGVGDLDGDGVLDLLVGDSSASIDGALLVGRVYGLSGADLHTLFSIDGAAADNIFGSAVAYAYSQDQDGRPSFLVGAPSAGAGAFTTDGSASLFAITGQLGLSPAEIAGPSYDDGIRPAQTPRLAPGATQQFAGVDGTPPYTYALVSNRSGATLVEGLYTAGSQTTTIASSPAGVFDTVRVTDRKQRSVDTRIYVQTAAEWPPRAPNRPHAVQVTPGSGALQVSWTYAPPTVLSSIEQPPTGFLIEYRQPTTAWQALAVSGNTARSAILSGLTGNASYIVRVKTVTAQSDSLPSNPVTATTL